MKAGQIFLESENKIKMNNQEVDSLPEGRTKPKYIANTYFNLKLRRR